MFRYKMVEIPPILEVVENKSKGDELAKHLETCVNHHAENGSVR